MGIEYNRHIFREYDVRGIVETDLPPELVVLIGKAVGTMQRRAGATRVAVGRDCRLTSESLAQNLTLGLMSTGLEVVSVGEVPTPLLYFATHMLGVGGGVMVTGSHNAAEYNGFKILVGKETLHGADIGQLKRLIDEQDFEVGEGSQTTQAILEQYQTFVRQGVGRGKRTLKVVVDAGNGTGGVVACPLYRAMGHEVVDLFCQMDGRFPNHHPDPTVEENLQAAVAKVKEVGADLAIAFDGDADRIGVVDDQGTIIWGDRLMILLARQVLASEPGATIIGEVKCSQTLFDDVRAHGGNAIMWKVGHSLIKAKMKESGAMLAGEMSGHIFFKHRFFGFDDAIYTGARLLEILSSTDKPLSQLLSDVPVTVTTPEIRMDCPDDKKFKLVEAAAEYFSKDHQVVDIDGVRVLYPDGAWGLVRASNTQPALVMRFEAHTKEALAKVRQQMEREVYRLLKSL